MKRSDIFPMPEYFDRYINLVADIELMTALDESLNQLDSLDRNLLTKIGDQAYVPGKWTVKGILQHVIDFERVFAYRALLFARKECEAAPAVDETALAANMNVDRRGINELIDELKLARLSTKALFAGFDDEMLRATGISWKYEMPVLGMGFLAIGHQLHHLKIVEERYYPLAKAAGG